MIENPGVKMKELLTKFSTKQISLKELATECAYWYLDCFDEIKIKPLPTIPNRLQEYYNSDEAMRQKTPREFWLLEEVRNYFDQKKLVEHENKTNLYHLKTHLEHIAPGDFIAIQKFREKIIEFESKYLY